MITVTKYTVILYTGICISEATVLSLENCCTKCETKIIPNCYQSFLKLIVISQYDILLFRLRYLAKRRTYKKKRLFEIFNYSLFYNFVKKTFYLKKKNNDRIV